MTFPTTAQLPQAGVPVRHLTRFSNKCNYNRLGFIHQDPVVARDSQKIIGHELMLNNSSELLAGNSSDAINLIHDELLLKSLLNANLSEITDNTPVFIRLSPASLDNSILKKLHPKHLILAIHPNITKADTLLMCCRELKSYGYHFALDDLNYSPGLYPLLGLADYLRFSINRDSAQNLRQQLSKIPRLSEKILVAKNIDSPEQLQLAYQLPFLRFQGSYFGHATLSTPPASNRLREKIVFLMNLLENGSHQEIIDAIKQDSALSGKIMRYVNLSDSPHVETHSLDSAGNGLDQVELYRWLGVLLFNIGNDSFSSHKQSILESALLLGRLTELFGLCGLPPDEGTRLFVTGLFSQPGALFNTTSANALKHFSRSEPMTRALLHQDGPYAPFLKLAIVCIEHDQPGIEHHARIAGISIEKVDTIYVKALVWAHEIEKSENP